MISVGFSTYDRAGNIPELFEALAAQQDPGEPWEIIAVDNGGPPQMREVIEAHLPPNGRYVRESRRGSSNGRNRFFAEARGDIVILTDDDALPEPGWLRAYAQAAAKYPQFDIFTGPVHYVWRCRKPQWFPPEPGHEIILVYKSDHGTADVEIGPDFCIGGHNICLRRERIAQLGGFDPRLGPGSPRSSSGEDGELFRRWLNGGSRAMYVAAAETGHRIYAERATGRTLIENYHRAGYSAAWETRIYSPRNRSLPMPAWWLKMLALSPLRECGRLLTDLLARRPSAAMYHRLRLSLWRGQMRFIKDLMLRRIDPSPCLPPQPEALPPSQPQNNNSNVSIRH